MICKQWLNENVSFRILSLIHVDISWKGAQTPNCTWCQNDEFTVSDKIFLTGFWDRQLYVCAFSRYTNALRTVADCVHYKVVAVKWFWTSERINCRWKRSGVFTPTHLASHACRKFQKSHSARWIRKNGNLTTFTNEGRGSALLS